MRRSTTLAMSALVGLTLIVGAGTLWASWDEVHSSQAAQKRQGQAVEVKLCSTFGRLGALKPPPGDAKKNPSRAYEQSLHTALVQLGTDLGCRVGE